MVWRVCVLFFSMFFLRSVACSRFALVPHKSQKSFFGTTLAPQTLFRDEAAPRPTLCDTTRSQDTTLHALFALRLTAA